MVGAVSIGSFEGSRFVRGGRYGVSIDFGLEVVEKENACWETFKSKFVDLTMKRKLTIRLIVTRDGQFFKTDCRSRTSDAARFGHATASAAKWLSSNAPVSGNPLGRLVGYAWKCDGPALSVRHTRA